MNAADLVCSARMPALGPSCIMNGSFVRGRQGLLMDLTVTRFFADAAHTVLQVSVLISYAGSVVLLLVVYCLFADYQAWFYYGFLSTIEL